MGNSNIIPKTQIHNLDFKKENSLVLSCEEEDLNYKINIRAEKKKMKLINKHNEEGKDSELIASCLSNHFLLKLLDKPAVYEIVHQLSYYHIDSDVEIFIQGQYPGYFYILSNGICESIRDRKVKNIIGAGSCFGELSLIYGFDREYTVRTQTECYLWAMEKKKF